MRRTFDTMRGPEGPVRGPATSGPPASTAAAAAASRRPRSRNASAAAGMVLGLSLAGCAQLHSSMPKGKTSAATPGPVGMAPVPSIHETINRGEGNAAITRSALKDPADPHWSGRVAPPQPAAGGPSGATANLAQGPAAASAPAPAPAVAAVADPNLAMPGGPAARPGAVPSAGLANGAAVAASALPPSRNGWASAPVASGPTAGPAENSPRSSSAPLTPPMASDPTPAPALAPALPSGPPAMAASAGPNAGGLNELTPPAPPETAVPNGPPEMTTAAASNAGPNTAAAPNPATAPAAPPETVSVPMTLGRPGGPMPDFLNKAIAERSAQLDRASEAQRIAADRAVVDANGKIIANGNAAPPAVAEPPAPQFGNLPALETAPPAPGTPGLSNRVSPPPAGPPGAVDRRSPRGATGPMTAVPDGPDGPQPAAGPGLPPPAGTQPDLPPAGASSDPLLGPNPNLMPELPPLPDAPNSKPPARGPSADVPPPGGPPDDMSVPPGPPPDLGPPLDAPGPPSTSDHRPAPISPIAGAPDLDREIEGPAEGAASRVAARPAALGAASDQPSISRGRDGAPRDAHIVRAAYESPSPRPRRTRLAHAGRPADQIAARVGEDVITLQELVRNFSEHCRYNHQQPSQIPPEQRNFIAAGLLNQMIEHTLLAQEAKRIIGAKHFEEFTSVAEKVWHEEQIPPLEHQYSASDERQLREKLEERGRSLETIHQNFRRAFIAEQFLHGKIKDRARVELPDLLAYYNRHVHTREFDRPARITWRELVVETSKCPGPAAARQKAEGLLEKLRRGADFAQLARAESDGPTTSRNEGGRMQTTPGTYAVPAVNAALQSLPLGQISDVLEGESSYHIVRVEARRDAGPATFEEVQDQIRNRLAEKRLQSERNAVIAELRQKTPIATIFDGTASDPALAAH